MRALECRLTAVEAEKERSVADAEERTRQAAANAETLNQAVKAAQSHAARATEAAYLAAAAEAEAQSQSAEVSRRFEVAERRVADADLRAEEANSRAAAAELRATESAVAECNAVAECKEVQRGSAVERLKMELQAAKRQTEEAESRSNRLINDLDGTRNQLISEQSEVRRLGLQADAQRLAYHELQAQKTQLRSRFESFSKQADMESIRLALAMAEASGGGQDFLLSQPDSRPGSRPGSRPSSRPATARRAGRPADLPILPPRTPRTTAPWDRAPEWKRGRPLWQ
jgi:hypothetical protein